MLHWQDLDGEAYANPLLLIRATIERVIAHFKNWWIMHTDYRRPLDTFPVTISTIIALHFWATPRITLNDDAIYNTEVAMT